MNAWFPLESQITASAGSMGPKSAMTLKGQDYTRKRHWFDKLNEQEHLLVVTCNQLMHF